MSASMLTKSLTRFGIHPTTNMHLLIQALIWFDLTVRIVLAELNRLWNRQRQAKSQKSNPSKQDPPECIASVVGYREEPDLFDRCLKSYFNTGIRFLCIGVDGQAPEDEGMVKVFEKVYGSKAGVVHLPLCVGTTFVESAPGAANGSSTPKKYNTRSTSDPFQQSYNFMKTELEKSGLAQRIKKDECRAICFTQPHRDLKEIRFAGWVMCTVIADLLDIEYLWSSDSDTIMPSYSISNGLRILDGEPKAAGVSALVRVENAEETMISKMAATVYATEATMNRAANAALGTSECLNGPGSLYRISAQRDIAAEWYRKTYPGSGERTVINEDMQATMLLGKKKWMRLYSERVVILTGAPSSLGQWIGQRLRWSRGINLHRWYDFSYVVSQGPLYAMYMARSMLYDVFVFIWVTNYLLTGRNLLHVTASDFIFLEILPPVYNFTRSTEPWTNVVPMTPLYVLHRLTCPSYRMYTMFTPWHSSWALSSSAHKADIPVVGSFLRKEHESLFVTLWFMIAAGACMRAISEVWFLQHRLYAVWGVMIATAPIAWKAVHS